MKNIRIALFKQLILGGIGALFGGDIARRMEKVQTLLNKSSGIKPVTHSDQFAANKHRDNEYVPLASTHVESSDIRCIAFYLPKFHAIPENDEWWGTGYSEWIDVAQAHPEFEGHFQPQMPGDLGFYDLTSIEIQRRQAELATMHGIYGFCYYFYWFQGKTLLETPLKSKLGDKQNQLPFCLCWANEDWARCHDISGPEILVSQTYSAEDDLAFIAYISPYLRDERYIRVDGKPLLIVYRAGMLPDAAATAARWREYCRIHDVGEIFLVNVRSIDQLDPLSIGFDAAIDLAPNASHRMEATSGLQLFRKNYGGRVFDYRTLVQDSAFLSADQKPIFPSVCPGWDNTPDCQERALVFSHSSPAAYQEWLENIAEQTLHKFEGDKRLIFINAWNEWSKGANLEPNRRLGYAYLNATAKGLASIRTRRTQRQPKTGVIVHIYYEDLWHEIAACLKTWASPFQLYATITEGRAPNLESEILRDWPNAVILRTPNRGRDIAPFLRIAMIAQQDGVEVICKIHTKKSVHRIDGETWRKDMYAKLIQNAKLVEATIDFFKNNAAIGLVAPAGHVVSLSTYWGANRNNVIRLARQMGYTGELMPRAFIAGSMFWVRTKSLAAILKLSLTASDFEEEAGQVDGTIAHAIERLLPISAKLGGFRLVDTRLIEWTLGNRSGIRSDLELACTNIQLNDYPHAASVTYDKPS